MRRIKILVTGLCLSRNRGGPAMALSFMEQIKRHLSAEFTFSVDPTYIDLESQWGERYGVKVVPRYTILGVLSQSPLLRPILRLRRRLQGGGTGKDKKNRWRSIHREYIDAFKATDCIINLNGIAFVGDASLPWINSLTQRTDSIYAKKLKKPFFRFIQSYGPLEDWRVKLLAKLEFRRLPCVMARGRLAASYCKKVSGDVPVYAFPDVAITLSSADDTWLYEYLDHFNLKPKEYVVVSPSAIIASMPARNNSSVGDKHIAVYAGIAKHYISSNNPILFVPHATSPHPAECDRMVCRRVIEMLTHECIDTTLCHIIEDELDCRELKAIIGNARQVIVSRYHALVAAVSVGVPVVCVGWNEKYQDLLDFYKSTEFAVDARIGEPEAVVDKALRKISDWTDENTKLLRDKQAKLEEMVKKAAKICADWIVNVTR